MKISLRNTLMGQVRRVEPGVVNGAATIELTGGTDIVPIVTRAS
jgi:molybdopterin-binding protein